MNRGFTLVEVIVACLILAVLAIAGSSFVVQSSDMLASNRNRYTAVARANSRLEEVCATPFGVLTNLPFVGNVAWIKWTGTNWMTGTNETYARGGVLCPLQTRLTNGTDRLLVTVWAGTSAQQSTSDMVRLDTVYAPLDTN